MPAVWAVLAELAGLQALGADWSKPREERLDPVTRKYVLAPRPATLSAIMPGLLDVPYTNFSVGVRKH